MSSVKQDSRPSSIASLLLAGVVTAVIWLAAGALLLSLLLSFSSLKESSIPTYVLVIHSLASLAGGFAAGRRSESKGWYNGSLLGVVYAIIIILISFLASNAAISWESALLLGAALIAGAAGGMIGVNLRK